MKISEYPVLDGFSGEEMFIVESPDGSYQVTYEQLAALIKSKHNEEFAGDISEAITNLINSGDLTLGDLGIDLTDATMINCYENTEEFTLEDGVVTFTCLANEEYAIHGYIDSMAASYVNDDGEDVTIEEALLGSAELLTNYLIPASSYDRTISLTLSEDADSSTFRLKKVYTVQQKLDELAGSAADFSVFYSTVDDINGEVIE